MPQGKGLFFLMTPRILKLKGWKVKTKGVLLWSVTSVTWYERASSLGSLERLQKNIKNLSFKNFCNRFVLFPWKKVRQQPNK